MIISHKSRVPEKTEPEHIYSTIMTMVFLSIFTLQLDNIGKHCRHSIAIMGVVDSGVFGSYKQCSRWEFRKAIASLWFAIVIWAEFLREQRKFLEGRRIVVLKFRCLWQVWVNSVLDLNSERLSLHCDLL